MGNAFPSLEKDSLARALLRLGWGGSWVQVAFCSLTILFMAYSLLFSSSPVVSRSGFPFVEYLTIANLLVLFFTIFWSYHYTRIAKRMMDPATCPPGSRVMRTIWTGVGASTLGMVCSVLVMLIEVATLLFFFLRAPEGGIPVVQTGAQAAYWVSSVDMVSLLALALTLAAEITVLAFSLWVLFRASAGTVGSSLAAAS
jgi:hypothetical protein